MIAVTVLSGVQQPGQSQHKSYYKKKVAHETLPQERKRNERAVARYQKKAGK